MSDSAASGFETFLQLVLPHASRPHSTVHGIDHWRRVAANGAELAARTLGADPDVVAAFAALHDSQRHSEYRDPEHGERAARLALELPLGLSRSQLPVLVCALFDHDRGRVTDHPTIGCCWDADRLDLTRLGVEPLPELLSTTAAKGRVPAYTSPHG